MSEADHLHEHERASLVLPFYLYEGADFDDGSWFVPCARAGDFHFSFHARFTCQMPDTNHDPKKS